MSILDILRCIVPSLEPIGVVVVNDFSQDAAKLGKRLGVIVGELRAAGLPQIYLTSTQGSYGLQQLARHGTAPVKSPRLLGRMAGGWGVVVSDKSLHVSTSLVVHLLEEAERRHASLTTDRSDPLVHGMGLWVDLVAVSPGNMGKVLEAWRVSPSGTQPMESLEFYRQVGLEVALYRLTKEDIATCYARAQATLLPVTVQLETSTRCNFSCLMCPYHGERQAHQWRFVHPGKELDMPLGRFKELVQEIAAWDDPFLDKQQRTIVPYRRGEPLMYRHFHEAVGIVKDAGQKMYFATNGSLLDEKMRNFLIDSEVDHFKVSMHGSSQETFARITGRELDPIAGAVRALQELKRKKGRKLPEVGVVFAVQDSNRHETEAYVKEWLEVADYVALSPENRLDEATNCKKYQEDLLFFEPDRQRRPPCRMLIDYAWVNAAFDVMPCIGGIRESLGNVESRGIAELLEGSALLRELRETHGAGHGESRAICSDCQVWYGYEVKEEILADATVSMSSIMKIHRRKA